MNQDNHHQNPSATRWKKQVVDHFQNLAPNTETKSKWRDRILASNAETSASLAPPQITLLRKTSPLTASILSAVLAASLTFLIVKPPSDEPLDPIAELAQLPGPKVYPPDFDLEGDSKAMNDIVFELFADKDFFVSDLPAQVLAEYQPSEGRFFSWDGEPAVSIQMNRNANPQAKKISEPATLLIVKLSEKSQRKFPKEKLTRKVAGKSGKVRKVKVWREGNFGYAMVQDSFALNDTP
ncbi:MAG: hypothetical protein FJY29_02195 [Betaproteobacteria bacterium]|nr:hypothetical protein [Betaproteobacteria bacterium]